MHQVAAVGSAGGVRYALQRLMEHGTVEGERVGGSVLYSLNRDHLTFPALDAAFEHLDVRRSFEDRVDSVRAEHYSAGHADPLPIVALFGSVARDDARLDSDVDLLVVVPNRDARDERFADALATRVRRWTGQDVQTYLTTPAALAAARTAGDPIVASFRRDARVVAGGALDPYLTGAA